MNMYNNQRTLPMRYVAVNCLWHCILLAYRLRGMWFMIVHEYILAVSSEIAKSRNPLWNPEIRFEIQKSALKSRNPLWNPEIHFEIQKSTQDEIQKSTVKSRNPLWNPEIHFEIQKSTLKSRNPLWNPEIHSEIRNPREIQWISKSRTPRRAVADPSWFSEWDEVQKNGNVKSEPNTWLVETLQHVLSTFELFLVLFLHALLASTVDWLLCFFFSQSSQPPAAFSTRFCTWLRQIRTLWRAARLLYFRVSAMKVVVSPCNLSLHYIILLF